MSYQLDAEQRALQDSVLHLCEREFADDWRAWDDPAVDKPARYRHNREILGAAGLLGIRLPERFGGGGGSVLDLVVAIEAVARYSPYTAHILSSIAGNQVQPLLAFAADELRTAVLPDVAAGRRSGAVAISEPGGGSNVGALTTRLNSTGSGLRLTGSKCYISDGDVADYFITAARIGDEAGLAGVGLVYVESSRPGVAIGRIDTRMTGGREAEIHFQDVPVDPAHVLLGAGQFMRFLKLHNAQRCGNSAVSLGIAGAALSDAMRFARERPVKGGRLAEMQGIRWMIADIAAKTEAARMLVYRAAANYDADRAETPYECFLAKLTANESAVEVTGAALQILGCMGLSRDLPMELRYRYAKGQCVAGGTTQILRNGLAHQLLDRAIAG